MIGRALVQAKLGLGEIDAVAATAGPGLIGGVLVGATMGKAIALGAGLPFIAVNHLEGAGAAVLRFDSFDSTFFQQNL